MMATLPAYSAARRCRLIRLLALPAALTIACPGTVAAAGVGRVVLFQAAVAPRGTSPAPEGTAWLVREDEDLPSLTVPLGREVVLPPGSWRWQGEGPDFVTVGWNAVPERQAGQVTVAKARAVPSCELSWTPPPRGNPPDRVQVVALEAETSYDIDLKQRSRWAVPAGRFFLAAYRQGVLLGVDEKPRACGPGATLAVTLPGPPANTQHALVVPLELPAAGLDLRDLWLGAQPSVPRGELQPVAPEATVWMGRRGVAVFPRLQAQAEVELRLKHPKLRSLSRELPALGGGATALARVIPRLRPTLTIPVDYRPARPHKLQKIVGYFCGLQASDADLLDTQTCRILAAETRLRPGVQEYSFPDLDDGQYLFNAQVDDEEIYGLSNWFTPYLAPEAVDFGEIPIQPLKELHIYGHVLEGEEPVPGSVRVVAVAYRAPDLVAVTDDELTYHLYYFGKSAIFDDLLAELPGTRGLRNEDVHGLFYGLRFNACDSHGSCKAFPNGASLAGEGRFDFQLGANTGVEVRVIDAETRAPLPGANVSHEWWSEKVFLFYNGKSAAREPSNGGTWLLTDPEGRARLRLPAGSTTLAVSKVPDYEVLDEDGSLDIEVPEDGWAEVEVELKPSRRSESDPRFVFPGGQPVSRGFLAIFDAGGKRRAGGCATSTRLDGTAHFRDGCLDGAAVALLHPGATVTLFRGNDLAEGGRVVVELAPRRPGRLRVVDDEGKPRPGVFVNLAYGSVVLEPVDFAIAHGLGQGPSLVGPSDSEGIIALGGVDLSPAAAPSAIVLGSENGRPIPLSSLEPGGTLDVELSE